MLPGPSPGPGPPMFSPHSAASPFLPSSTNNSSLSDKLKLGFGSEARPPGATPLGSLHHEASIKKEDPSLRSSAASGYPLASASRLVTTSSHSGENDSIFFVVNYSPLF